ncbi:uncharacterized protein UTRI_04277 [Ustilago trichophora]|uniref:Uncharacterized protein n=1 Tax=Ustilago trichophora TaxID=86804 RepID=A0A5C3EPM7_9BASI|nr:uncharacterized protein UTRI_04277 [Ustilago trichophora]
MSTVDRGKSTRTAYETQSVEPSLPFSERQAEPITSSGFVARYFQSYTAWRRLGCGLEFGSATPPATDAYWILANAFMKRPYPEFRAWHASWYPHQVTVLSTLDLGEFLNHRVQPWPESTGWLALLGHTRYRFPKADDGRIATLPVFAPIAKRQSRIDWDAREDVW